MSKSKLFIENMVVYGFGQVIAKIIPFIMLPIITRLMPNSYYMGINDMNVLVVSFGAQIAIMGMYDAMFRLYFDKDDNIYKKSVCSSALANCFTLALFIFLILVVFRKSFSILFFDDTSLSILLMITASNIFTDALKGIISAPTRIMNKKKTFLIVNTITPLISYGISIPLLINGNFLYALPIASLIASASMLALFFIMNHNFFDMKLVKKKTLKELLKIGIPLMPTFLIYWIFSSFDRVMILQMLGASENGIYAVGNKVSMISQLVYQAFTGGWSYFSFSTMKDTDQVKTNTKIFNYLAVISFLFYAVMVIASNSIFNILFTGDYIRGSVVFPYLFLSPLFLMLFQILGNQFIIIKKSYLATGSLVIGAVLNVILNYILIPIIGIEGAAFATLIGYIASLCCAMLIAKKHNLYINTAKFNLMFTGIIILIMLSVFHVYIIRDLFSIVLITLIGVLYYSDFKLIIKKFRRRK